MKSGIGSNRLRCWICGEGNWTPVTRVRRAIPSLSRWPRRYAPATFPKQPFADLLVAFRQDQTVTRYPSMDDVLDYCRYSANPVGRLVLYACGYRAPEMFLLSDFTCTALQLANFWQDISSDYARGRIYLPLDDMQNYGVDEATIARREPTPAFRELLRHEVDYARQLFIQGSAL